MKIFEFLQDGEGYFLSVKLDGGAEEDYEISIFFAEFFLKF